MGTELLEGYIYIYIGIITSMYNADQVWIIRNSYFDIARVVYYEN